MKCWRKACNLGKNSFSLTPSRKANTPLKLTNEISCICCAVRFFANNDLTTTCNYVDLGVINDVRCGSDIVAKVFLGWRTKILRAADAFYAWRREGPYRFIQNRSRAPVAALKSDAEAERSKDRSEEH